MLLIFTPALPPLALINGLVQQKDSMPQASFGLSVVTALIKTSSVVIKALPAQARAALRT